jgi:DNA-binding beta-propeller fold protein YncE
MPEKKTYVAAAKVLCVAAAVVMAGCAAVEPLNMRDATVDMVWPPPPNPPRIRYLREINGPAAVIPEKGRLTRLVELVTGESRANIGFYAPYGIVSDGEALIYVADTSAGLVHRYDLASREVSHIFQAGEERLASPAGVALDRAGNLYVTDSVNAKLYKFKKNGEFLHELHRDGKFQRPAGIAVNSLDEKYVVDVLAHKLYVFDKNDRFLKEFPGGDGGEQLNLPSNVAVDRQDNVYVTDSMNFVVRIYNRDGVLQKSLGEIGDAPGSFARPKGVAVDSDRHIYAVDANHGNFQIFDQAGKLLLYVGKNGNKPGEFNLPSGIFIDGKDRIFVSDTFNHRIQIFQYLKEGGNK